MLISLFFCLFSFTALYSMEDKVTVTIKTMMDKNNILFSTHTLPVKLDTTVSDIIKEFSSRYYANPPVDKLVVSAFFALDHFIPVKKFHSLDGQKVVFSCDGKLFVQITESDNFSEFLPKETTVKDIINTYNTLTLIIHEKKPN